MIYYSSQRIYYGREENVLFGYVRVYSPQLKVWENELYKSIYCGLCKFGGKRTTRLTRFFLSYDFVALATVRMALTTEKPKFEKRFCPYFPKKKMMVLPSSSLEYTADSFIILAYYKLLDDKKDNKGLKRLISSISPIFLKTEANKAEKRCLGLGEIIRFELERLDKLENNACDSIDKVADCFSVLLGKLLAFGLNDSYARIAYEIGYHIGRYIYIIDAIDDFKKDLKENNYNPLINVYKDLDGLKNNIDILVDTLKGSLKRVENALKLIDDSDFSGIIENIISYGCDSVISQTVEKIYS